MKSATIKSFKHDGSSHRLWDFLYLIKEDDDYYYLGAYKAKVIEDDGREWRAPEGALYILSKKRFFNVIVMFKKSNDIEYYVNLASPTVRYDDQSFTFIDYDLDLKRGKDKFIKELDWGEYNVNKVRYNYSNELRKVVEVTMKELHQEILDEVSPFNDRENLCLYNEFLEELAKKNFARKG